MSYSVAPHLNPSASAVLPDAKKQIEHANGQMRTAHAKSVELAGSGVTSVFPDRLGGKVREQRGPSWLKGFLYWLQRKEKGTIAPYASCVMLIMRYDSPEHTGCSHLK